MSKLGSACHDGDETRHADACENSVHGVQAGMQADCQTRPGMFRAPGGGSYALTFALVCSLFLLSALCNSMIDVLNKHFQNSLGVSKAQSTFVQGVWYAAYFFMALPSGWVARRFGYKAGILTGLLVVIGGCLLFVPVTRMQASAAAIFAAFLAALFVLGSGLTFLETIANPYATVLGPAESGVARINLGQSCNAVGWIVGPLLASSFVLSRTGEVNTSNAALCMPYLIVATMVALMVVVFSLGPVPELHAQDESQAESGARRGRPLHHERHFSARHRLAIPHLRRPDRRLQLLHQLLEG